MEGVVTEIGAGHPQGPSIARTVVATGLLLFGSSLTGCNSPPAEEGDHGLTVQDTVAGPDSAAVVDLPGPLETRPPPPGP